MSQSRSLFTLPANVIAAPAFHTSTSTRYSTPTPQTAGYLPEKNFKSSEIAPSDL